MGQAKQRGTLDQRIAQSQSRFTNEFLTPGEAPPFGWLFDLPRAEAKKLIGICSDEINRLRSVDRIRDAELIYLDILIGSSEPLSKTIVGGNQVCANILKSLAGISDAFAWNAKDMLAIPGCMVVGENNKPHIFVNTDLILRHYRGIVKAMLLEAQGTLIHELVHASGNVLGRELFVVTDTQHRREYITEEAIAIITSHCVMDCIYPGAFGPINTWKRMISSNGYNDIEATIDCQHIHNKITEIVDILVRDVPECAALLSKIDIAIKLLEQSLPASANQSPKSSRPGLRYID